MKFVVSRLRDLTRMNPSMLFGSNMGEDTPERVEEVYKIIYGMGVTSVEKAELSIYKLRNLSQVFYTKCKKNRLVGEGLKYLEVFKKAFLDRFFPL